MNQTESMPAIMIISEDALEYAGLLSELAAEGVAINCARTGQEATAAYRGQAILLGEPDLIAGVLHAMPTVEWVQSTWAGVTPLMSAARRDFVLTVVKDTFGPQMAEYVLAYLLARELDIFERLEQQKARQWHDEFSGILQGKRLGIMGTGSIGRHIAAVAGAFGMSVSGLSRRGRAVEGFERVFMPGSLDAFLQQLDYLVAVLPDTPATDRMLDARAFKAMPRHCYFINIGRGNLVDEAALADALARGELAGAVLDVFSEEPLPQDSPLWTAPGLLLTGHVAARSWPEDIAKIFIDNYWRHQRGDALRYSVDFEQGY